MIWMSIKLFMLPHLHKVLVKSNLGKADVKASLDTGAGKNIMSYSTYLLIGDHLKTPLHPNYVRLTTLINIELNNKWSTLIISNLKAQSIHIHSL